jgi:hypothetical protein
MFADLMHQVYQAQFEGNEFSVAEVGTQTWARIIDTIDIGRRKRMTDQERAAIKEINFMGISVTPNSEVEEDKLHPLEGK